MPFLLYAIHIIYYVLYKRFNDPVSNCVSCTTTQDQIFVFTDKKKDNRQLSRTCPIDHFRNDGGRYDRAVDTIPKE